MSNEKHNPKLNRQTPYRNPEVCALPLAERRKVAVDILLQRLKDEQVGVTDRSVRKACDLSGRQFRKAVRQTKQDR